MNELRNLRQEGAPQKIRKCLEKAAKDLKKNKKETDGEWTKGMKEALHELGKNEFHLKTCASGIENDPKWGEWLYDLIWVEAEPRTEHAWDLESIYLVAESEWGNTLWHIVEDFDKLLLARCQLKLMIFRDIPGKNVKQIAAFLTQRVSNYITTPNDDLYILAGCNNDQADFSFFEISHEPNGWTCRPTGPKLKSN